ncbi:MAG: M48 family metallopeptidase [Haloarculaceae archaeon]
MGRLALRTLMVLVGLSVLAVYGIAAYLAFRLLVALWLARPPLATTLLLVGGLTLLLGYLSYQVTTTQLLAGLDAAELPRARAPDLYRRLDAIADRMAVEQPRVFVADMPLPNALSLGGARGGAVVVDRALFRILRPAELDGIVAHELAHLESRDGLVQTLAFSLTRTAVGVLTVALLPLLLFATGLSRGLAWIRGRPGGRGGLGPGGFQALVNGIVAVVLLGLLVLVRAHSRRREYAADDRAAAVTGRPVALARALRKIERVSEPEWGPLSPLYTRGDEDHSLARVLSTHPATDDRIDRLLERADRSPADR